MRYDEELRKVIETDCDCGLMRAVLFRDEPFVKPMEAVQEGLPSRAAPQQALALVRYAVWFVLGVIVGMLL